MYGLLKRDLDCILQVAKKYSEIEKIILFGSRAMGNYKKASDIDIALKGNFVTKKTILRVNDELNEEYPIPFFFDVLNYNEITNPDLKFHIDTEGKILYQK